MELKGKKAVFLGDSITEGVGVSTIEKGYVNLVKEKLELSEAYNRGISGTRIAIQKLSGEPTSFDQDFISRVDELPEDVELVVVFGGTNDYGHGNAPFGEMTDRTGHTFCGACHVLFEKIVKKYYNKQIVVMTPIHRIDDVCPEDETKYLKKYVDVIKTVAAEFSIPVLDLYATAGIVPAIEESREAYCPDGLHPNDAGNEKIAEKLVKFIKNL